MDSLNLAGIILVILLLGFLIVILRNNTFDNFIVFLDEKVIPKTCWDYLVTNGSSYFLLNSRILIDGVNNPIQFKTKDEALVFLSKNKCPTDIPFVDLVMRKKNEDPVVSYQRECNRKIAPNLFNLDICGNYGSNQDTLTNKYLELVNKIESDKKIYSDYDLESCMISKAISEDPQLEDTNFITDFKQYFDRMNSTIDESYLYITGR